MAIMSRRGRSRCNNSAYSVVRRGLARVRTQWLMPFKSKAQRRKFAELLVKGEISNETFEEWNRETGRKQLPERVKPTAKKQ